MSPEALLAYEKIRIDLRLIEDAVSRALDATETAEAMTTMLPYVQRQILRCNRASIHAIEKINEHIMQEQMETVEIEIRAEDTQ